MGDHDLEEIFRNQDASFLIEKGYYGIQFQGREVTAFAFYSSIEESLIFQYLPEVFQSAEGRVMKVHTFQSIYLFWANSHGGIKLIGKNLNAHQRLVKTAQKFQKNQKLMNLVEDQEEDVFRAVKREDLNSSLFSLYSQQKRSDKYKISYDRDNRSSYITMNNSENRQKKIHRSNSVNSFQPSKSVNSFQRSHPSRIEQFRQNRSLTTHINSHRQDIDRNDLFPLKRTKNIRSSESKSFRALPQRRMKDDEDDFAQQKKDIYIPQNFRKNVRNNLFNLINRRNLSVKRYQIDDQNLQQDENQPKRSKTTNKINFKKQQNEDDLCTNIKQEAKAQEQKVRLQEEAIKRQELSRIPTHRTQEYKELLEYQLEDLDNAVSFVGFGVDSDTLVNTYSNALEKEAQQKKALAAAQIKQTKRSTRFSRPISRKNSDKKNLSSFLTSPISSIQRRDSRKPPAGKITPSEYNIGKNEKSTTSKISPRISPRIVVSQMNNNNIINQQISLDKRKLQKAGSIEATRLTTEEETQQSKATNSVYDIDMPRMSSATIVAPSFSQFTNLQMNKLSLKNLPRFSSQSKQINLKQVAQQPQLNNPITPPPLLKITPKQESIKIQPRISPSVTPISQQNKGPITKYRKNSTEQPELSFKPQIIRNYKFRRPYQSAFKCQHIIPSCVECKPTNCQPSFTYGDRENYIISHVKEENNVTPSKPNLSTSSMLLTIPGIGQAPGVVEFQRRMQEDLDKRQFKSFINNMWPLDGRLEGMLHPVQRSAIVDHFVGRYFGYGNNQFNVFKNQSKLIPIKKTAEQISRNLGDKEQSKISTKSVERSPLQSRKGKRSKNSSSPSRQHLIQWQQWCSGEIELPNSDLLDHDYGKVVEEYQNFKENKQKSSQVSKKASTLSVNHGSIKKLITRNIKTPKSISQNRKQKKIMNSKQFSANTTAESRSKNTKSRFDSISSSIKANQITNLMNNTSQLHFNNNNTCIVKSETSLPSDDGDIKGLALQINTNSQFLNTQSIPSFVQIEQQQQKIPQHQQFSPSQTPKSKKHPKSISIPPKNVLITQQDLLTKNKPISPTSKLQAMKKHIPEGRDLSAPPLQFFEIPENIRRAYTGKSDGKLNSFSAHSSKLDLEQILDSRLNMKGNQNEMNNYPCNISADNLIRIAESQSNNTLIHQGYVLKSQPHALSQSSGKFGFIFKSGDIEQIDQKIEQEAAGNALKIQKNQAGKRPNTYNNTGANRYMHRGNNKFFNRSKKGRMYSHDDDNFDRGKNNTMNSMSSHDMGMLFSPGSNQSTVQIKSMTFEQSHPELAKIISKFPGPKLKNGSGGSGAILERHRKSPRMLKILQKEEDQQRFLRDGGYKIHNSLFIKRIG